MDRNLLLAFALSMAVFSGWLAWQQSVVLPERREQLEQERAREAESAESAESAEAGADAATDAPADADAGSGDQAAGAESAPASEAAPVPIGKSEPGGDTGDVTTWEGELAGPVATIRLSNVGGTLIGWRFADYFETPRDEVPVELIDLPPGSPRTLATPFEELGLGDLSDAMYEVEQTEDDAVRFVLRRGGVEIRKTYTAPTDGYTVGLAIEVTNRSGRDHEPRFTVLVPAATNHREDFRDISMIALANGDVTRELVPSIGVPGFFSRIFGGGDDGPIALPSGLAFAGFDMRYFAGVVLPENRSEAGVTLLPVEKGRSAMAAVSLSGVRVASGASEARRYTAFFGPKQPATLARLGDDVDYAISRGGSWIAPLTTFFEWALHRVHDFLPNYGVAIIVLTLLVRLATWPIMVRQMKSAERMRELMPRIKELQEKFKDDRQRQSEETFKLYRESGVNPLGGCLPMLLQLPVFIGLFYALQSSIDLRHAPFFLWIDDLSAPATLFTLPGVDFPIRVLPVLMAASMYIQQKMTPQAGMDPAQAKMMLILMPGMMLVISYTFPSGLVLYWLVSNVLGIAHQLYVRRQMHAAEA
ncbi:MAG TPA: membrane protein insertase YidC [Planctomycetota bacterium]|nr:membrane protein insertase YidC [Planctomycetota bacterium]